MSIYKWGMGRPSSAALAIALCTVGMTQSAFAQSTSGDGSGASSTLADIIVTAQKREQNLQNVPISVTALGQDAIKGNRIENVKDLNGLAPNLTIRFSGGGAQLPNYTLRGIYTSGAALGTDKGVGLYLDGVYIQSVVGSVFDIADIERIEILKGPQGTLFGRNVTGGAISITTRGPTGELGVRQEFTYGNYDQLRSKTRIDLPKFGPFSAALSYLHSERRGDVRNLGAGFTQDFGPATGGALGVITSPKYLGGNNTEAIFAAVKAELSPDIEIDYKFDWSRNHYSPSAQGVGYLFPDSYYATGNPLKRFYLASPNPMTPVTTKRPGAVNNGFTGHAFNRSEGHNLTARWHASDTISFKNVLSYRKGYLQSFYQLDGLGGLIAPVDPTTGELKFTPGPVVIAPLAGLVNSTRDINSQWSNEFQVNIDTQWFNLTAGYLYFQSKQETEGFPNTRNLPYFTPFAGQRTNRAGTPGIAPGNPGYRSANVTVKSHAFFLQPEFHLTDQIDLVGGMRLTKDQKDGIEPFPVPALRGILPIYNDFIIKYRDSRVTYMLGVNVKPTNDILVYGKYATGYISGGQIATIPFDPERAASFEVGIKSELFDRRLRSNLSLFSVKYKKIQYNTAGQLAAGSRCSTSFTIGDPAVCVYGQATIAAGDADVKGFEWENSFIPTNGLTLTANLGYTDFKWVDGTIFPGFLFQSGAAGYQVQARPKWNGQLAAQYESPEIISGGHLMARLDGNFKSKELLTTDLSPSDGPTAVTDPAFQKVATVPMSWIVNARLALTDISIGGTKAEIALWSRNLLQNRNISQLVGVAGLGFASVIYEPARTFGLDIGVAF